jgi:Nicastrin
VLASHTHHYCLLLDINTVLQAGKQLDSKDSYIVKPSFAKPVPPTPLTSFLQHNASISGFVVAGYDQVYNDPLYHRSVQVQVLAIILRMYYEYDNSVQTLDAPLKRTLNVRMLIKYIKEMNSDVYYLVTAAAAGGSG